MKARLLIARVVFVLALLAKAGCYYAPPMPGGSPKPADGSRWWLILAVAAAVGTAAGVSTAINGSKNDPDRRMTEIVIAGGGAFVAPVCMG